MATTCLNCDNHFEGNYCNNCGQRADTHRINFHFLWHDIQHGFAHLDKGIVYTSKELSVRPGHAIREFIEGKRVKHFKPISLVLVLAGIYGLLSHYFNINMLANNVQITGSGEKFNLANELVNKMSEWISEHYAIIALFQIPVMAIGTFLGFINKGYNYFEHLILNTYLTGQRLILHIVLFPLYYFYNGTQTLRPIARAVDLIGYILMAWALFQFFNQLSNGQRILRTILSLAISLSILFLILTIAFKSAIASIN